jgi:predicted DNA-binding protein
MKKTKRINLRLTQQQYNKLDSLSKRMGMKKSEYLRKIIKEKELENDK